MKHYKKLLTVCIMLAAFTLGGCGSKDPGTPPEILLDGTPVVVGVTTPGDLKDAGFVTDDLGSFLYKLPDRSWTSSIYLKKDSVSYAGLTLVNESREDKYVNSCVIEELHFYALEDKTKEDLNISINGVNPIGMSQEELKETFPDLELDDDTGDYRFHYLRNGDYSISFYYKVGVLDDIRVCHTFPKSYQSR